MSDLRLRRVVAIAAAKLIIAACRREYLRLLLQQLAHPREDDRLNHSLQVFDLARAAIPYDTELAEAALLHDVGKGIDPVDAVAAGLHALEDVCSERVLWLVAHRSHAERLAAGKLGRRATKRLRADPRFDDLMALRRWAAADHDPDAPVPTVDEALDWIVAGRG